MAEEKKFCRWSVEARELAGLTPEKARDLVVQCFCEAQRETISRVRESYGATASDEEIRKSVTGIIKLTFREIGAEYDAPTKDALLRLVQSLAVKAESWGTPKDIIEHHKGQIMKIMGAL